MSERAVDVLQDEIEKAKESLKDVDDTIKKLTGRDPTEQRVVRRTPQTNDLRGRGRLYSAPRRGAISDDGPSPVKRRIIGTAFSRLGPQRMTGQGHPRADSGDEEELPNKPTVQSSVVYTPKEERSRRESIEAQNTDKKGTARNKRMFGLLLGTLRKFKDEARETEDKVEQRKQIEQKLENKFIEEKEEIIKERRQLFQERKQKQARIQKLEQKMELVQLHENWVEETKKLVNFIQTKAKPPIFYLPKAVIPELQERLADSATVVDEMIAEKKKRLDAMIEDLLKDETEKDGHEEEMETENGKDDKENREEEKSKSANERQYRRRSSEGNSQRRRNSEGDSQRKSPDRRTASRDKRSPNRESGSKKEISASQISPRQRSPRKSHDHVDRRRSGDGDRRRVSKDAESSRKRRSYTEGQKGDEKRRRSDGDRGRDHHRSGRRGEGHSKSNKREVKINYDDEEMDEEEVSNANPTPGQSVSQGQEVGMKIEEENADKDTSEKMKADTIGSDIANTAAKVKLAEDAEEGEEGGLHDVMDE